MDEKKELQLKYEEVFHKLPFHGWSIEQLEEKIKEKMSGEKQSVAKPAKNIFKGVEIDPKKTYNFKSIGIESPRIILAREMQTWDDELGIERTIRLCDTEQSPYVDEQEENARLTNTMLSLDGGNYNVSGMKANIIRYILASDFIKGKSQVIPENEGFRNLIELEDTQRETASQLKREDEEDEANDIVRNASIEELRDYLQSVYLINLDDDGEVKLTARRKAKDNPVEFVKNFNNPLHKLKANVQKLLANGELSESGGVVKWAKTGAVAVTLDRKVTDVPEGVAKFVLAGSKEAKAFKDLLDSKL